DGPASGTTTARRRVGKPSLDILLVEDSPFSRTLTLAFLQDQPYRVDIAENGAVACKKFARSHYDVVLMDRQMPVMDGLAAARAIREWERVNGRPPTPIIAMTASIHQSDQEKCMAAGCTGYVAKPMNQQTLLEAIRKHALV